VRTAGNIVEVPLAYRARMIDFGAGDRLAVTFPWGDVATAYFSTGIPNIEVYIASAPAALLRLRRLNRIRKLLAVAPIEALAKRIAGRVNTGPSAERFASGTTYVWGEASNSKGSLRTARLTTSNGYRLTVDGVLLTVRTLLAGAPGGGYYTPLATDGPALCRIAAGIECDRDQLGAAACPQRGPDQRAIMIRLVRRHHAHRAVRATVDQELS
jgi:short subunit dehydrogenase-like uncharacterized protein